MVMDGSRGQNPGTLTVRMVAENSWWMDVDLPISTDGNNRSWPIPRSCQFQLRMKRWCNPSRSPNIIPLSHSNEKNDCIHCSVESECPRMINMVYIASTNTVFFKISIEISTENGEHVAGRSWFTGKNSAGWTISLWPRNSCCWSKSHFFGLGLTGMSMNRRLWHVLNSV